MKKINKWLVRLLQIIIGLLEKKEKAPIPKMLAKPKMPTKKSTEVKGVNLLIIRDTFSENSILGKLFVNGERMCDTLELPYKDNQKSISCIPAGEYSVRLRPAYIISQRQYRQRH